MQEFKGRNGGTSPYRNMLQHILFLLRHSSQEAIPSFQNIQQTKAMRWRKNVVFLHTYFTYRHNSFNIRSKDILFSYAKFCSRKRPQKNPAAFQIWKQGENMSHPRCFVRNRFNRCYSCFVFDEIESKVHKKEIWFLDISLVDEE